MKVRDFGHYFEVPYTAAPIYTMRLPHPNVDASLFIAWLPDGTQIDPATYTIDQRNGILKLQDPNSAPDGLGCSGYYYEWFLNEDLAYAAGVISNQVLNGTTQATDGSDFSPVVCDAIATGAAANAFWSLCAELSLDVDVSTPEGMMIPAHQRYQQVWQMAGFWEQKFKDEASVLNIGIWKIDQYWLRRTSYLTNRLVPIIKEREVDDPRFPQRVLNPIPDGTGQEGELVYVPEPPGGISGIGWQTIMTSGSP
jgi:hypothetical protein